jgi:hypothetical protein
VRYLLLLFLFLFTGFFISLFIKPYPAFTLDSKDVSAPAVIRNIYSDLLWREAFAGGNDYTARANVIKRILRLNPDYDKAYYEVCSNYKKYVGSGEYAAWAAEVMLAGYKKTTNELFMDCYVNSLLTFSDYEKALGFLEQEHNESVDPYKKAYIFEKIRLLKNEQNIVILTRAVEDYYKVNKTYPRDITLLKDQGMIDNIPDDPYGGQYFVGVNGQIRSTSERSVQQQ